MAYIYRTPGSAGSNSVFTLSFWVKRAKLGAIQTLYSAGSSSEGKFVFNAEDQLEISDGGSDVVKTTRLFRDVGAWYHIVLAYDTGESGTDKVKLYTNGTLETAYATDNRSTASPLNYVNDTVQQNIGADTSNPFYGEMSHVQMVDGAQLAPTEFGEVDSTSGIWKIKTTAYATPGTNGFYLKMEDRTNLDLDSSSNAFTWTTSGTLTATYDNPSNNFCTMNPLQNRSLLVYNNGNNTIVGYGDGYGRAGFGTTAVSAGKWYFEEKVASSVPGNTAIGISNVDGINAQSSLRFNPFGGGTGYAYGYRHVDGDKRTGGTNTSYGDTYTEDDIISCAFDLDNNKIYFAKNGVWQDSGDPTSGATGTGAAFTIQSGEYYMPSQQFDNGPTIQYNFGNGYFGTTLITSPEADDAGIGAFKYDVPAGYYALCTKNIKAYGG